MQEQHALQARVEALQSVASNAELRVAAAEAGAEERYCELYGELQSLKRVLSTSQALATGLFTCSLEHSLPSLAPPPLPILI